MRTRAFSFVVAAVAAVATAATIGSAPVHAQVAEATGNQVMQELRALVSEGTGVVGDLQPLINGGKVPADQVATDALVEKFKVRYQKATSKDLDIKATGPVGDVRRAYLESFRTVITKNQGPLTKGGQDAFVPAYFRALVLKEFNTAMKGKVRAYASNREDELINSDSGVHRVLKGMPLAGEVDKLMATGSLDPVVKRSGDNLVGYWPMKLGAACVACHAKQGLTQKEGGFGGALVAIMTVK